jgi:hypothetical protein
MRLVRRVWASVERGNPTLGKYFDGPVTSLTFEPGAELDASVTFSRTSRNVAFLVFRILA